MLVYKDDYIPDNPDMPIKFFSGKDDPCYVSEKKMTGSIMLLKKTDTAMSADSFTII